MLDWDEEYVERSKNAKRWIRYNMVMIDNEKNSVEKWKMVREYSAQCLVVFMLLSKLSINKKLMLFYLKFYLHERCA